MSQVLNQTEIFGILCVASLLGLLQAYMRNLFGTMLFFTVLAAFCSTPILATLWTLGGLMGAVIVCVMLGIIIYVIYRNFFLWMEFGKSS